MFARCLLLIALLASLRAAQADPQIRVSSFSTILTEICEEVGGDRVQVTAHVKPGVDPHDYEPKPQDLEVVSRAQLILLSARNMEGYVGKLRASTGGKARLVEVGNGFESFKLQKPGQEVSAEGDPHWWHSISCMKQATKIVRDALIEVSPADRVSFEANAARYEQGLDGLAKWARSEVAQLPRDKRVLVTSHDAFQYLAAENGFVLYPIEGMSSADQPSAKRVAGLIALIKAQGVKAIFAETLENPKVLQEITRETGAVLGGELAADGLGSGETATYQGMYKHNLRTIVEALK